MIRDLAILLLSISLILVVSATIPPAFSHWDSPPSGEPHKMEIVLYSVDFYDGAEKWNDNLSGSDLVLGWRIEFEGHPDATSYGTEIIDDHKIKKIKLKETETETHYYYPTWKIDKKILSHNDCSPIGDVRLSFWMVESDRDSTLESKKMMDSVIKNPDLSTTQATSKAKFEKAGDEFVGFTTRVLRSDTVSTTGDLKEGIDDENTIKVSFLEKLRNVYNENGCNVAANSALVDEKTKSTNNVNTKLKQDTVKPQSDTKLKTETKPSSSKDGTETSQGIQKTDKKETKPKSTKLSKDDLKLIYVASKWYELAAQRLYTIKNFELEYYSDLTDSAWGQYSKSRGNSDMTQAQKFEQLQNNAKSQVPATSKILEAAKQNSKESENNAIKAKNSPSDLQKAAKEPIQQLKQKQKIISEKNLKDIYKDTDDAITQADKISDSVIGDLDWTSRFSKKVDELKNNLQPKTSDASSSNQEKTKLSTKQRPYVLSKEVSFRPRDECFDKNKEYTIHVRWVFENIPEFDSSKGILNARVGMGPLYDYFVHSDKAFVELNAPAPIPGVYTFEYSVYGFENRDNSLLEIILPEYCDGSKTPERIERQPMPDQSDVESDTKQLENTKEGRNVAVLLIKDHYYPIKQFILAHPDECKSDHYHSYFPQVHSIDGVYIGDEKKSGCGFGTVEEIPKTEKFMTQDQINTFEKDMGFEP